MKTIVALALAASLHLSRGQEAVAAVLIAEAGGEPNPRRSMQAVLNVIDNRAHATHKTRLHVITRPKQFSCLNRTTVASLIWRAKQHPRWAEAVRLVSAASVPDITGGALYYHEKRLSPKWAAGMQLTKTVGDHKFYAVKPKKEKAIA